MNIFNRYKLPNTMRLIEALGADLTPPIGNAAAQAPTGTPATPGQPVQDPNDEVPDIDHPANHPAVQASHKAYVEIHDALAANPCAENIQLFIKATNDLIDALETYVPGCAPEDGQMDEIAPEEMEGEDEEDLNPPGMPNQAPQAEEEGEGEDEGPPAAASKAAPKMSSEEDDDDEEKPKRESNAYTRMMAQMQGEVSTKTMNTPDANNPHKIEIRYDSADQTPWHLATGKTKLSPGFTTRNEAEAALKEWVRQSQGHMEMMGKENAYDAGLIPSGSFNPNGSKYGSVMGGEEQNFKPPYLGGGAGGPKFAESQPDIFEQHAIEQSKMRKKESPPDFPDGDVPREAGSARVTESPHEKCSMCSGSGCGVCGNGYVNKEELKAIREACNSYAETYGSSLMQTRQLDVAMDFNSEAKEASGASSDDPNTRVWAMMRQNRAAVR